MTALLILFMGCPESTDFLPAPQNVSLAAEYDGLSMRIVWEPDTINEPDGYIVYFDGQPIDTTRTSGYVHERPTRLGTYQVTEYKGDVESNESDPANNLTIAGDIIPIRDINSKSPNGFGWTRDSGRATSHPMTDSANITPVDFYITNFRSDTTSLPYYIASPNVTQTDSTVVWPLTGTLHTNGFCGPLPFDLGNADTVPDVGYQAFQRIESGKVYCAYTQDGYFALVKIAELDSAAGRIMAQTVFQPVRNLRLFRK